MKNSLLRVVTVLFSTYSLVAISETEPKNLTQKEIAEVTKSIGKLLKTRYFNR